MYRAIRSWFVNVEVLKDRMVELNKTINWVPGNVGSGRFHNWLSSAKDWCIARSRYWGTPIPIWANVSDPADYIVIDSVNTLETYCNLKTGSITDLHRDKIDDLEFKLNGKTYRRIPDVFDCWFESGSMPYASIGYPFKTDKFTFPADFIAEGIDQTRGWFYTLLVISTALFDKVPFRNVVVNGLILASDGKKMSKRLKNYPDPMDVVNKYGSDALRLYLLNSPATKADTLKFNEVGVAAMVKDIIIPLKNSLNFYSEYVNKYNIENETNKFTPYLTDSELITSNPLDAYAIKYICSIADNITTSLDSYQLTDAVRYLLDFVEQLNNRYIKFNRFNLKGKNIDTDPDSWLNSLRVLHYLLVKLSVCVAPIAPFFAEYLWLNLNTKVSSESVHLFKYENLLKLSLNADSDQMADEMIHVLNTIQMVFNIRSKNNISMINPLEKLIVKTAEHICPILSKYSNFILDELNVLDLETVGFEWSDVQIEPKSNFMAIKETFPDKINSINKLIGQLSQSELIKLSTGSIVGLDDNIVITPSMVNMVIKPNQIENHVSEFGYIGSNSYCVYLNNVISERVKKIAFSRFIATKFQRMRKFANLHPWDHIKLVYGSDNKLPYDLDDEVCSQTFYKITNLYPIKYADHLNKENDKLIYQRKVELNEGIDIKLFLFWA